MVYRGSDQQRRQGKQLNLNHPHAWLEASAFGLFGALFPSRGILDRPALRNNLTLTSYYVSYSAHFSLGAILTEVLVLSLNLELLP